MVTTEVRGQVVTFMVNTGAQITFTLEKPTYLTLRGWPVLMMAVTVPREDEQHLHSSEEQMDPASLLKEFSIVWVENGGRA